MPRVICDTYVKGEKHIWTADKDDWSNREFNRKILAVNDMYGWLYETGILRETAFEIKDYSDVTIFAMDVKDLEPYREKMAASGLKDVDVALRHIFDEYYTPCEYSGAIELGWTMMGYRDVDGCVGRSWECGLLKGLDARAAHDVLRVLEDKGVKDAVSAAFEFAKFLPSDLTRKGERMTAQPLREEHRLMVEELDALSGNCVSQWLEGYEGYAWGVFVKEQLVGYCTIGNEYGCESSIQSYPGYTSDSLLLSDVFVVPEHRGQGCGNYLVDQSIRLRTEQDKQRVFLSVLDDNLCSFYQTIGFKKVGDGIMMRDERDLHEIKREEDFEKAFAYFSEEDPDMVDNRDYLFDHAEKLIYCFEADVPLDMMGVDFWAQYEYLLGESLDHNEYLALNSVLDGDPYDIEKDDVEKIDYLRKALAEYREEGYEWEPRTILSLIEDAVLRASDLSPVDSLEDEDLEYEESEENDHKDMDYNF